MTFDEATQSVALRAPLLAMQQEAKGNSEHLAYLLTKWARKNVSPEEQAALNWPITPVIV